jgi:hypothetical protein
LGGREEEDPARCGGRPNHQRSPKRNQPIVNDAVFPRRDRVFVMRVIVALVVATISFSLSGCSRPPQAEHPKLVRSKWVLPQSQRHVPKFTEASAAKTVTKASRPVSKRSKKFKTHLAKPAGAKSAPASADKALLPQGSLSWLSNRAESSPMLPHRPGSLNKHSLS